MGKHWEWTEYRTKYGGMERDEELGMGDMQEGVKRGGLARSMESKKDCINNKKGR